MLKELITAFIIFFTVIDPIGTIPVFIAVTVASKEEDKKRTDSKNERACCVSYFFLTHVYNFGQVHYERTLGSGLCTAFKCSWRCM